VLGLAAIEPMTAASSRASALLGFTVGRFARCGLHADATSSFSRLRRLRRRRDIVLACAAAPETAPFSPAWKGSLTTVERAMRLIHEGALDDNGTEVLAGRLGIGARHLNRLFQKHLGASPTQVARTARVQRAKRLIDGTDLPMTEIALCSGFRSLRRFNAVFAEVYKRPPTAIRRVRHLAP
jgi:transcriptional regulator GlxA family with amidase domain